MKHDPAPDLAPDLAGRLRRAATGGTPVDPEEAGRPDTLEAAYAVQDAALALTAGEQVIGYRAYSQCTGLQRS